ncbi:ankyrin repeat domain-containing protein [Leptospira sarikeiensis]|nr:ankyrin repeat domain-containing protein [Leptospira sarikeiensis]
MASRLVKAAVSGNKDKVAELVKEGANPNYLEPDKVPMLVWTICAGSVEGFEALLKAGADPNLGGTGHGVGDGDQGRREGTSIIPVGWSAMVFAATINDPRFLKLAIQYGGDLNAEKVGKADSTPGNPMVLAAYHGIFENIKILVDAGADINFQSSRSSIENGPEEAIGVGGRFDIAVWFLEKGYTNNLQGLAVIAEARGTNARQSHKEKLIDMLIARGIKFPNPNGSITRALREREIPESEVMNLVYGRKNIFDFPLKSKFGNK